MIFNLAKPLRLTACWLVLCLVPHSILAQGETLNIYSENSPPYHFFDKTRQQIVGINTDLLRLVLEAEKVDYQIRLYPWSRAFKMALEDEKGGVISTARVPSRESRFKWVGPFMSTSDGVYLFKLKTRNDIKIQSFADLRQYITGHVRQSVYEDIFKSKGLGSEHLMPFTSNTDYMKMLFNGKIDLATGSLETMGKTLADFGYPSDHVVKAFEIDDVGGAYLALNPKISSQLVERLNRRLIKIKNSPKLPAITQRYTTPDKEK